MSKRWSSIGPLCLVAVSSLGGVGSAQCPDWSPAFTKVQGLNSSVSAATVFDDGTGPALYAAGAFTLAGGASARRIAKWDGEAWSPLSNGTNDEVRALAVFDDGSGSALYAGGAFGTASGVPAPYLAAWNGQSWSSVGTGFDDWVNALAVFDDGSGPALYAAGWFSTAGGSPASRIAKWDGQSWSALGSGLDATVYALAVFDDGSGSKLYAAGDFLTAGGSPAHRIAKWNGSVWSPLTAGGAGFSGVVNALSVFDDGSGAALYAGGDFTVAQGSPGNHIAKWKGQSWSQLGNGTDGGVHGLCVFDDGSGAALYVGGSFATAGGWIAASLARWNGSAWSVLTGGSITGGGVSSLCVFDDGSGPALFAGGGFFAAGGLAADHIAKWTVQRWKALPSNSTGLTDAVSALALFDDGGGNGPALYAGGSFKSAGETIANGIARWNGGTWSALGTGFVDGIVYALTTFDDGGGNKLYAGGFFGNAGGVTTSNIARFDGTSWGAVGSGLSNSYRIQALAAFDDGQGPALYAGGYPATLGLTSVELMKWDGSSWSSLPALTAAPEVTASISALTVFDDGQGSALYAGGTFNAAGSLHLGSIGKWDGSQWKALANGTNGSVYAIAVFDDGHGAALYIAGDFTNPANRIARWNGSGWSSLSVGTNGAVRTLTVFDDGHGAQLYAGGDFTQASGTPANGLAMWNGAQWSPIVDGAEPQVQALLAVNNGSDGASDLYVGGNFTSAGGVLSPNLAKLSGCSISAFCYGDGSSNICPCFNEGLPGHGCDNSVGTGGARLSASGSTRPDNVKLSASGELASALSIFLQGDANLFPGVSFGDGVRCAGGNLKRLYSHSASGGVVLAPAAGDPSITARSAALGDSIAPGSIRFYQTYYRDPNASFCPAPQGDTWNVTNAIRIIW